MRSGMRRLKGSRSEPVLTRRRPNSLPARPAMDSLLWMVMRKALVVGISLVILSCLAWWVLVAWREDAASPPAQTQEEWMARRR